MHQSLEGLPALSHQLLLLRMLRPLQWKQQPPERLRPLLLVVLVALRALQQVALQLEQAVAFLAELLELLRRGLDSLVRLVLQSEQVWQLEAVICFHAARLARVTGRLAGLQVR